MVQDFQYPFLISLHMKFFYKIHLHLFHLKIWLNH